MSEMGFVLYGPLYVALHRKKPGGPPVALHREGCPLGSAPGASGRISFNLMLASTIEHGLRVAGIEARPCKACHRDE